jgi:hypothetical protein
MSLTPNEEQLQDIFKRAKNVGDKGKLVTDSDLLPLGAIFSLILSFKE